MTQETKTAMDLYARYKRAKGGVDRTEENTRILKNGPGDDLRFQLIHEDVKKWIDIGEELHAYCRGKLSIKRDLEEEIRKIDAKIQTEAARFDRENKAHLSDLQQTISNADKKSSAWDKTEGTVNVITWLLAIGWIVFYFFVFSKQPTDPTFGSLRRLIDEIQAFGLLLPPIAVKVIGFVIKTILEHFLDPVSHILRKKEAKNDIEAIKKKRAELIASIEKEKEDYLELMKLI